MPPALDIGTASLVLSTVVCLVAALLGASEWRDRRRREPELPPEDASHFSIQNVRRSFGIVVLFLLAAGVTVGSRIPPRLDQQANPRFVGIWLGVFLLIFVLLALALLDWIALRRYALRHRREILRERMEIIREEARLRGARRTDGNGHGDGHLGDLFR